MPRTPTPRLPDNPGSPPRRPGPRVPPAPPRRERILRDNARPQLARRIQGMEHSPPEVPHHEPHSRPPPAPSPPVSSSRGGHKHALPVPHREFWEKRKRG